MAELKDWIGRRPADSLSPQDIEHWLVTKAEGLTPATLNRYRALLPPSREQVCDEGRGPSYGARVDGAQELMGPKTIQMTVRYAHLAAQHRLAVVQRLCDTEAVKMTASDTRADTGQATTVAANLPVAAHAIELSVVA